MRKISRAEENYTSLNFRTADVKPWGQEEHFRIVDSDTPLTEGGPKCEGCGGKMQEHGSNGSVCRNRACNKRDMVITSAITKNVQENKWKYYPTLSTNNGVSRKETEHCGRCDIVMDESKKSNRTTNKTFGKICKDCHDVLKSGE